MGKVAQEQIAQLFNYIGHLERVLKQIKDEAEENNEALIVDLVNIGLSYGKEEDYDEQDWYHIK